MLVASSPRRVAIIGGIRTPFARSHTAYAGTDNQELLTASLRALVERFDLQGKRLGAPVAVLLGGSTGPVPAYASGGYYRPDDEKLTAVMRPSKTLNAALAEAHD